MEVQKLYILRHMISVRRRVHKLVRAGSKAEAYELGGVNPDHWSCAQLQTKGTPGVVLEGKHDFL